MTASIPWTALLVVLLVSAPFLQDRLFSQDAVPTQVSDDLSAFPVRLASNHLPNVIQIHPNVISGGLPEGDQAFQELASRGVRTIISVDGARPDRSAARRYGLRYVHLPHGYDGISEDRKMELAKAVRELPGLIYIHCHHGKHRSPTAASVACVAAGLVAPSQAVFILEFAGTNENYRGLYQSARDAKPIDHATLDRLEVKFRERAKVPPMAEAMVALEKSHDHLKHIAASGWRPATDHPDVSPAHEALMMHEHFAELLRTPAVDSKPAAFQSMLRQSAAAATALQHLLEHRREHPRDDAAAKVQADQAATHLNRISDNCAACHARYRDAPLKQP